MGVALQSWDYTPPSQGREYVEQGFVHWWYLRQVSSYACNSPYNYRAAANIPPRAPGWEIITMPGGRAIIPPTAALRPAIQHIIVDFSEMVFFSRSPYSFYGAWNRWAWGWCPLCSNGNDAMMNDHNVIYVVMYSLLMRTHSVPDRTKYAECRNFFQNNPLSSVRSTSLGGHQCL